MILELSTEHDIVLARQRARQLAEIFGFEHQDQVRIATAVSEIARNAYQYAKGGKITFDADGAPPRGLMITVADSGGGIRNIDEVLAGKYVSQTGMGMGIIGAKRLMDSFEIDTAAGKGTTVVLGKKLPKGAAAPAVDRVAREIARYAGENPLDEIRQQNQDLLRTLEELRQRQSELSTLNQELEDTNRGVVALYAELDERADFLRRASELKSKFLSNMTHEFRTPLNSILSLTQLLLGRMDGELTPDQEKQVLFIRKSAEDLSELVNDLLDLAKVEAGKLRVRASEFDAPTLFGTLRGMLRPMLAANSSVSLVFEEPVRIPVLNTDEGKVSQILRNFISNALKFTEKGEVRVSARGNPDKTVTFSVKDTGIGIAPQDQERIFEEYAQVESPLQNRARGTGLGLPLSRKLAELLGGRIDLVSQVGVGSTFSVTVPIRYSGPAEVAFVPEVRQEIDPAKKPVLVVEDNRETLFVYDKFLKGTSVQLIPARTVKEARNLLTSIKPVAVMLDILLEGESTWDFLSELKQNPATKDIPVLVATMVDNQHKAQALGAEAFCVKPIERSWLLAQLQALCEGEKLQSALVIDDDEIARYLLRGLLSETKYSLVEANDGRRGLELASQIRPRVIFLDLTMPDLHGKEVLKRLQASPETRDIPVIIYTSNLLSDADRKALSAAVSVLPKDSASRPIALARLRQALTLAEVRVSSNGQPGRTKEGAKK